MGVEVKPSTLQIIVIDNNFLLLQCSVHRTAVCHHHGDPMDVHCNQNLCIMSDNNCSCCAELQRMLEDSGNKEMEEEMDEEEELVVALAAVGILSIQSRNFKWQDKRLNWSDHLAKLQHAGEFDSTHRMSFETFTKLKGMLGDCIILDAAKSNNSTPDASNHICPEIVMHIGLWWLAGGAHADIGDTAGVSTSSACRCRDLFIDAALDAEDLAVKLPNAEDPEELKELADWFRRKSSNGVMQGCLGCIDGLLATNQPSKPVNQPSKNCSVTNQPAKQVTNQPTKQNCLVTKQPSRFAAIELSLHNS